MRNILAGFLILLSVGCFGQPTQRIYRATIKLQTDSLLVYKGDTIPLNDVTYNEYSSDTTNWHKEFVAGDNYLRISNDLKETWVIMRIMADGVMASDSTTLFVTPTQLKDSVDAVVINTDSLVHKGRTETITGAKTFTQNITTGKAFIGQRTVLTKDTSLVAVVEALNTNSTGFGLKASAPYVGIEGNGTGEEGYGVTGNALKLPFLGMHMSTTPTGRKSIYGLRGNSASITVQNDFGLDIDWYLPVLGWTLPQYSEKLAGQFSGVWTDVTQDEEDSRFEFRLMKAGILTKVGDLNSLGGLTLNTINLNAVAQPTDSVGGQIYYGEDGVLRYFNSVTNQYQTMAGEANLARTFSLTLPNSGTVQGRCDGAVEGTDYPTGWTIGAWSGNNRDLEITHNLNRRIVSVSVYSTGVSGDRVLINTAAYSGILAPDKNILRIEGLATVTTPIVVNLVFN